MRIAMIVGSVLGFCLFLPAGLFAAGALDIGAGVFTGIIGGIIGFSLTLPIYFLQRSGSKQNVVDRSEPIRMDSPGDVQGLWRLDRHLVVDPKNAVFPQKCLFTNTAVDVLRPFTIGQVRSQFAGPVSIVRVKTQVEYLPVSVEWLRNQQRFYSVVQRIAIGIFCVGTLASLVGWIFAPEAKSLGILTIVSIPGLIISLILHKLGGFGGRQELYSAYFLEDGRIIINDPHPDFIAGLPELQAGFWHGVLGNEQLKEATSRETRVDRQKN